MGYVNEFFCEFMYSSLIAALSWYKLLDVDVNRPGVRLWNVGKKNSNQKKTAVHDYFIVIFQHSDLAFRPRKHLLYYSNSKI